MKPCGDVFGELIMLFGFHLALSLPPSFLATYSDCAFPSREDSLDAEKGDSRAKQLGAGPSPGGSGVTLSGLRE